MTSTVTAGLQGTAIVTVATGAGADEAGGSGLWDWTLYYETAPLANDTCGAWSGTYTVANSGVGAVPASVTHDVTALGSQCYRYQLRVRDNVANAGFSALSAARRVDLAKPAVAITSPTTGSAQSGTFTVSGTADDDHSGIDHVRLTWAGPRRRAPA
jgi:hypothetical protein